MKGIKMIGLDREKKLTLLVYSAFAAVMLAYFMLVPFPQGDDIWFSSLSWSDIAQWSRFRYNNWSSRTLIEILLVFFCTHTSVLCRFFASALAVLCVALMQRLFGEKGFRGALLACFSFLIFSAYDADVLDKYFSLLTATGFMATVMNYLLPAVFGLAALLPIKNLIEKKPISPALWVLSSLSIILACNQEQVCAVLLMAYAAFGVFFLVKKSFHPILALETALTLAGLIYIVTCPGNASRLAQETVSWNPAFLLMSLFEKLDVGISCTLELFFDAPVILILFAALLAATVFQKYRDMHYRVISLFPLTVCMMFGPLSALTDRMFGNLASAFSGLSFGIGWLNLLGSPSLASVFKFIIGCFTVICVLVSLYLAFGHDARSIAVCVVFIIGLASRAAMGFSPTAVISGSRTAFFMLLCVACICLCLCDELSRASTRRADDSVFCIAAFAALFSSVTVFLPLLGI